MNVTEQQVLKCQDCGKTVERITPKMRKAIVTNPHAYTVFCGACARERLRQMADHDAAKIGGRIA